MSSDELADYAQEQAQNFWRDAGESYLNRGFPLSSGSKVIDVGGYLGDWTDYMSRKHCCYMDVYEPVYDFCVSMKARFAGNPRIQVFNYALEDRDCKAAIGFMNDSTTFYTQLRADSLEVPVIDVAKVIDGPVDLMAINCEGSEYRILNRLIATGKIKDIKHLLVQFHTFVHNAREKRDAIVEALWKTHQQRWCYPFVWEAWSKTWRPED